MKKLISLSIAIILCLVAFAGCSSNEAGLHDRWGNEEVTFKIRLLPENDYAHFEYSSNPGTQVKPDGIIEEDSSFTYKINYVKETVNGRQEEFWVLEQSVTLKEVFKKANFGIFNEEGWKSVVNDKSIYDEVSDSDAVIFTTTMTSTVKFKTFLQGGAAVSSEKTVKGVFVYVGEQEDHEIWYNDYTVKVEYAGKTAKTTFTDRNPDAKWDKPAQSSIGVTEGVFDNEMFIFAMRALDLKHVVEQNAGSASFSSYNGLEQSAQTVTLYAEAKDADYRVAMYGPQGERYPYYFYFETVKTIVPVNSLGKPIPEYSLLKFSQGYLLFEK